MLLHGAVLVVAAVNVLVLGVSVWAHDSLRGAMARFAGAFAHDPGNLDILEAMNRTLAPCVWLLSVVSALNLLVMAGFYIAVRKGSSNQPL